jgi:exo-beta-1,3-glucanase (GH17 family)
MRVIRLLRLLVAATLLAPRIALAAPVCNFPAKASSALQRLTDVMATGRFVDYDPTSSQIINGHSSRADEESILQDLKVLRPRFDGLITYTSTNGAERIPDLAVQLGYRAVIMGIWDISSTKELENALAAVKRNPEIVVGLSIGSESVFSKRASFKQLADAVRAAREHAPDLAISTSEPFHIFLEPAAAQMLSELDFMLANVHPIYETWFSVAPDPNAADFVAKVTDELAALYCGPILVKETGVPTAPAGSGYTPARQASFYQALRQRLPPNNRRAFAYFCAFDAPWRLKDAPVLGVRPGPQEAHWGLYGEKRQPKPVVGTIPALPSSSKPE